jgi:hypothetical protein
VLRTDGAAHNLGSRNAAATQELPHQANLPPSLAAPFACESPFEPLLFARSNQRGVLLPRLVNTDELVHDLLPSDGASGM